MNNVYRVVHAATRALWATYGRWRILGHEKIPRTGPVIVACNHVSYLDPTIVGAAVKRECAFIARSELWQVKVLAWFMPRLGAFPIHKDRVDRQAIKLALEALEKGLVLVIFPEGTRSDTATLRPAEHGVALLVQKSGAPVVPAAVIGPEKMLPVHAKFIKPGRITCVFGDPIHFPPGTPREDILRETMRAIAALLTAHGRPMEAAE